jgi:hypothetical protein
LEERHHPIRSGARDSFARNPGGEWVNFGDLPEATRKALLERDECKQAAPVFEKFLGHQLN